MGGRGKGGAQEQPARRHPRAQPGRRALPPKHRTSLSPRLAILALTSLNERSARLRCFGRATLRTHALPSPSTHGLPPGGWMGVEGGGSVVLRFIVPRDPSLAREAATHGDLLESERIAGVGPATCAARVLAAVQQVGTRHRTHHRAVHASRLRARCGALRVRARALWHADTRGRAWVCS
jgi:hypothetical protein